MQDGRTDAGEGGWGQEWVLPSSRRGPGLAAIASTSSLGDLAWGRPETQDLKACTRSGHLITSSTNGASSAFIANRRLSSAFGGCGVQQE